MLTFQQFLAESSWDLVKGHPVYKNPSQNELMTVFGRMGQVADARGLVDSKNKDLYVWPHDAGTHREVHKHLGLEKQHYPIYISKPSNPEVRISDWDIS